MSIIINSDVTRFIKKDSISIQNSEVFITKDGNQIPLLTKDSVNNGVLGGDGDNQIIANGVGYNFNVCVFYINLSSNIAPSSISIDGSFNVYDSRNRLVKTNVTPLLSFLSSNRVCVLYVTDLFGIYSYNSYELRTVSNSKITINY